MSIDFVQRVERENREIEEIQARAMLACKQRRAAIREIYLEAKDNERDVRALKAAVKVRESERKLLATKEKAETALENDSYERYRSLIAQLGPLGEAAARAQGYYEDDDSRSNDRRASNERVETPY